MIYFLKSRSYNFRITKLNDRYIYNKKKNNNRNFYINFIYLTTHHNVIIKKLNIISFELLKNMKHSNLFIFNY